MLGAHVSLQVTPLNGVGQKHSYVHLLQSRYYYCPASFVHERPHEELEGGFHQTETRRIITAAIH